MNIRLWLAPLAPLTLAATLAVGSANAQQLQRPLLPAQPAVPVPTAAPHVHAPGQLEISAGALQKIRTASASNRAARIMPQPNAPQCFNGDFQSGTFNGWSGKDGVVTTGPTVTWQHALISAGAGSGTNAGAGSINSSTAHQTLVTGGSDFYAPLLSTTANGSTMAVRIGNGVNGYGAEALTKTFIVTQASMNFSYALVLENPSNSTHPASQQPGFMVRVLKSGVDITRLTAASAIRLPRAFVTATSNTVAADASNPFFKVSTKTGPNGATVVYKDWTCSSIDLGDLMGQEVTIEFVTTDCAQGGHAGWAYIDDICGACKPDDGGVTLNQAASTDCGPGKLCFDFTTPKSQGAAPGTTQLSLQLYQNGVAVGSPMLSPIQNGDGQWCYAMPPVGLNASLGGFDWVVTSINKIGSTTLTPKFVGTVPNGLVTGLNNDYAFTCKGPPPTGGDTCCPPLNGKLQTASFFVESEKSTSAPYTNSFLNVVTNSTSAPQVAANAAITSWAAAMNAYSNLLKFTCGANTLVATFEKFNGTAASPSAVVPIPLLASFTVTFPGTVYSTAALAAFNAYSHVSDGRKYIITATIRAYDSRGKEVKCFDVDECKKTDRFAFHYGFEAAAERMMQSPAAGSTSRTVRPSGLVIED